MSCRYCLIYQESESRMNHGRFCIRQQKFVAPEDDKCDRFEPCTNFRCDKNTCDMSIAMCCARQSKTFPLFKECERCKQGKEVLELRKWLGMRARRLSLQPDNPPERKKILKRRVA